MRDRAIPAGLDGVRYLEKQAQLVACGLRGDRIQCLAREHGRAMRDTFKAAGRLLHTLKTDRVRCHQVGVKPQLLRSSQSTYATRDLHSGCTVSRRHSWSVLLVHPWERSCESPLKPIYHVEIPLRLTKFVYFNVSRGCEWMGSPHK